MTQREEFEAWAVVAGWPVEKQDAHYVFDTTFAASTAWEAARAAQPVKPSQARELSADDFNHMWECALASGNPTAGNTHIRFARAIVAAINARETK